MATEKQREVLMMKLPKKYYRILRKEMRLGAKALICYNKRIEIIIKYERETKGSINYV